MMNPPRSFRRPKNLLPAAVLDPFGKLLPLLPDVDEARPSLQHAEGVAHVVLIHLALGIHEALLALAFDLARPLAPMDRPQRRRADNQTQARRQQRHDGLDGYV